MTNTVSTVQRTSWIANTLFHQALSVVTVFILWIAFNNYKMNTTAWHIILCTIAYVPLMAEAVILFWGDNLWSQNINRSTKYWIHGIILGLSAVSVSAGILLFAVKPSHHGHFKSTHGLTGFISWILVLLSVFLGFLSGNAQRIKSVIRPVYSKFVHNIVGITGYVMGVVSLAYGVKYYKRFISDEAQQATIVVLGIVTFWSSIAALKSAFNQLKDVFKSFKE